MFYLGVHMPQWLARAEFPLFVSHRRLASYRTLPRAATTWALDSGGFSELSLYGGWRTTEGEYLDAVARYRDEVGNLAWAAPMDWMCEPHMLERTGLTVREHQWRTVENYLSLAASGLPFIPVLQGWEIDDYLAHVDLYALAGLDLAALPLVGVGSVCRRQGSGEIEAVFRTLSDVGLALHGFGVKTRGLARYGRYLTSSDSMSWSYDGRRSPPLPGCVGHKNCANCYRYATRWRERMLEGIAA